MSKLWDKTLELLDGTDKTLVEICVGAEVTIGWLQSAKYGKGRRGKMIPAVDKAERLYEYLSGKKLEL